MGHLGFSHLGLATCDMPATLDFYQNTLGFRAVRCDVLKVAEGGEIQHVFFDAGHGQLELLEKGVRVTRVVDHEWCRSIYFKDPNGIDLEYCCVTRELGDDDARMQVRAEISTRRRPTSRRFESE
jgi:catechol 2,3-dioxygenase-like lactoylglutathione lyase family enzyme